MLAEVASWNQLLCQSDTVVFKEDNLQFVSNDWVVVNNSCYTANQLDDFLGHVVARCGFPSNHHSTWNELSCWVSLNPVVHCDDMKTVEKLTLVLVNSLDLKCTDYFNKLDCGLYTLLSNQH